MKRIASLLVAVGLLFAINMSAQMGGGRNGKMPSAEERLERMSTQLGLNDDQKAKIKPILDDESTQLQQLRQDSSLSRRDKMTKAREIHQAQMDKVRPILTEDQQKKLEEMQNQARGRMRGRPADSAPQQ